MLLGRPIVKTDSDYPKYATPGDDMIARMLHLSPDKSRLHNEWNSPSVWEHTVEYKIDKKNV